MRVKRKWSILEPTALSSQPSLPPIQAGERKTHIAMAQPVPLTEALLAGLAELRYAGEGRT